VSNERQDVYARVTNKIIADLEQGVRTWMKAWNAGHTADVSQGRYGITAFLTQASTY
jgi:antirestriction protein ArdC